MDKKFFLGTVSKTGGKTKNRLYKRMDGKSTQMNEYWPELEAKENLLTTEDLLQKTLDLLPKLHGHDRHLAVEELIDLVNWKSREGCLLTEKFVNNIETLLGYKRYDLDPFDVEKDLSNKFDYSKEKLSVRVKQTSYVSTLRIHIRAK